MPPSRIPETLLFGLWLSGFAVTVGCWLRWWQGVRKTRRKARPLNLNLPIEVLSSHSPSEPGVFGIWKPVLLLPDGITARLTPEQLEGVIAHELCHVRRRDNLNGAIHMLVEAIFWFHPLVWWIRARLVEERERACDEYVLSRVPDERVYAEGILNVCRFYLALPPVCAAGVTGSRLTRRIEEIMARREARNMSIGRKTLLLTAISAVIGVPVAIGMMNGLPLQTQTQRMGRLRFAVASIRENKSKDFRNAGFQFLPGGRFVAKNIPIYMTIANAYNLPFQSPRLTGGPDWIHEAAYDIEAKAEEGAIPTGVSGKDRDDKIRLMIQTLLADRFKLVMRHETKELPVYAVVVIKSGPKLQKATVDEKECANRPTDWGDRSACHSFQGGQGRGLHADSVTINDIASAVSNWSDRPVIDKTGLDGLYKIDSEGWVPMRPRMPRPPGQEPTAEDIAMADPGRPTLFQIFDRLGLKLDAQKAPVEMFVIESIERPSEN
jgi:uncharacterized protein (TIGR03435 family)